MACVMATLVVGLLAGHALTVDVQRNKEVARLQDEAPATQAIWLLRGQSPENFLRTLAKSAGKLD